MTPAVKVTTTKETAPPTKRDKPAVAPAVKR
jgi:hypothetical protein